MEQAVQDLVPIRTDKNLNVIWDVIVERGGEIPEMDVLFSEGHQQTSVGVQTLHTHIQSPTPPTKKPQTPQTPKTCKITQTKKSPAKTKGKTFPLGLVNF